jgi:RimJ/RimL family protein N-acetyltransferase
MEPRFEPVEFSVIAPDVRHHLAALPSAIDSFLEDHILASNHYRIVVGGEIAGFASIHGANLITQFSLGVSHQRLGQSLFARLRRMEHVQDAFVPTSDEFYLAHALDEYRELRKQAYFFRYPDESIASARLNGFRLRLAAAGDVPLIRQESGDFFDPVENYLGARQIFVTSRGAEPVGFGLLVPSALYDDVASIGMFTIERQRQQGVGTATIALLIAECRRRGLRPVAGCWYYNHASKRTLERAGMVTPTRLLRIAY